MSLILCRQEPVRHPFYIERLGVHIASSQELCYIIYQNPLLVLDGFVDDRLIEFIRSELGLSFLAGKEVDCQYTKFGAKNETTHCLRARIRKLPFVIVTNRVSFASGCRSDSFGLWNGSGESGFAGCFATGKRHSGRSKGCLS